MRYRLKEIPHLFRNPVGRYELLLGQRHNLWPLMRLAAAAYRRIALRKTCLVAVTGSLGKSTTMRAIAAAIGQPVPSIPPTNSWSGLALSIFAVKPSAPYCVLEAGISSRGHMKKYAWMMRPDISVTTSIASDHHRSLGTLKDIRLEKAHMARSLRKQGFAVLNGDDPNVLWMAGQTSASVVTYGFEENNDVRAADFEIVWPKGNRFSIYVNGKARTIQTKLFGRHMVYPILAAVSVGITLGRDLPLVVSELEELEPTPGRMETVALDSGVTILKDDYKSTLETIHAALDTLSHISAGRRLVVLGEVEDAPGSLKPIQRQIGGMLARHASKAIIACSRSSFRSLRAGAIGAGMRSEEIIHAGRNWFEAMKLLQPLIHAGDVVLIKGRRNQRLSRIPLFLKGKSVRCRITECKSSIKTCERCPMLERGWDGLHITA